MEEIRLKTRIYSKEAWLELRNDMDYLLSQLAAKDKVIGVLTEALFWANEFFKAREEMNAKVHCAPLRLSPITEWIKQALTELNEEGK